MTFQDAYGNRSVGRPPIYPFVFLAVGERAFIPCDTPRKIYRRASDHRPKKFRCRSMVVKGVPGVMVVRTA